MEKIEPVTICKSVNKQSISVATTDGRMVAAKTLLNSKDAIRELEILEGLQGHPNIIKLLHHGLIDGSVVITMDYHPRSLLDLVAEFPDGIPLPRANAIMKQTLSAVAHIHQRGFVHRDIKLENILIDSKDCIYVIDFGMSSPYARGISEKQPSCGSIH